MRFFILTKIILKIFKKLKSDKSELLNSKNNYKFVKNNITKYNDKLTICKEKGAYVVIYINWCYFSFQWIYLLN